MIWQETVVDAGEERLTLTAEANAVIVVGGLMAAFLLVCSILAATYVRDHADTVCPRVPQVMQGLCYGTR
jgi:hypothetical protein